MSSARLRKGLLLAVGVALVVALGALGGCVYVQSDAMRARVLARVVPVLESRLGEVRIGEEFDVGWDGAVMLGPVELPGVRADAGPTVRVERLTARPRLWALLAGRAEVDEVELNGVRIEAGAQGSDLIALLQRIREGRSVGTAPAGGASESMPLPGVRISDLHLAGEWGRRLEVGPISAEVQAKRVGASTRLEIIGALPEGGSARLSLSRGGEDEPTGRLELRDISVESLLAQAGLPFRTEGGTIDADVEVRASESAAGFKLKLHGLSLDSPQLAPEPVGPLAVAVEGESRWSLEEKWLALESVRVFVGENRTAQLSLRGQLGLRAEPRFALEAELQPLSFEEALAALPRALVPEPELLMLSGRFSGRFTVEGPVRRREDWEVRGKLHLAELERQARSSPLSAFNAPFDYRPLTAEGRGRELYLGPGNPDFVPYQELPSALVRAVLLSEDSMFFTHAGFDFPALARNLLAPKQEGEVVRGSSTITQQLAKNLFLSREKTYARKVKEALLTLALEASVPKERLLEIYFNAVEWGPDLYGIGEAARHYFDKDARDLSVREAVFLAAIIPNPVKYHVYCSRGALTETWEQRMTQLLVKMHGAGDLTFEQLAEAEEATLVFAHR